MGSYEVPRVDVNKTGWGPTQLPEQYMDIPYAPFNRNDKLGKVADFVSTYNNRSGRYVRDPSGVNADFQYRHDTVEDASFQLVDTAKTTRHRTIDRIRPTWNQQRFGARYSQNHRGRGAPPAEVRGTHQTGQLQMKGQQKHNKRWDRFNNARRAYTSRRRDDVKTDRLATVRIQADWRLVDEFDLQQLTKLQANIPTAEDIRFCGSLLEYDTNFDRMTSKSSKRLSRYDDREFFYVTTNADPVIEELAMEKEATVFATDAILAHLMACTRSVLPWDIVVHKVNNMIFFDKRDQSTFDFLTVNENAAESPSSDDRDSINHPDRLSLEATMINQNFSQSLMKTDSSFVKTFEHPNPFADEETKPAAIAYRYRKLDLGTETLIVRCEINGVSRKRGKEEYISTYALNEWDPKVSGNVEWRTKIDTQVRHSVATHFLSLMMFQNIYAILKAVQLHATEAI